MLIFDTIDRKQLQKDSVNGCAVLYDYLDVFLDFSGEKCEDPKVF